MWGTYKDLVNRITYQCRLNDRDKEKYPPTTIICKQLTAGTSTNADYQPAIHISQRKRSLYLYRKMRTCAIRNLKYHKYNWGEIITRVNSKHPDKEYGEIGGIATRGSKIKTSHSIKNFPSREPD